MAQALIELVRGKFPDTAGSSHRGDEVITVKREAVVDVIGFLRNDLASDMKLLRQIAAVDLLTFKTETTGGGSIASIEATPYSSSQKQLIELRVKVEPRSDDMKLPTITGLYRTADWWERYVYDMFGVEFTGHPNLKRLMLYPEFVGHPLRKDYPVRKRQLLVPELDFPDLVRGPGPGPGGAGVPMSQTHVGRASVDPNTYD